MEKPIEARVEGIRESLPAIRVAIVEDMQFFAEMLAHLCQQTWGMEVVALAHTGKQAYDDIVQTKPDVVLLDLGLPDINGATLAGQLNAAVPGLRIIVVSSAWSDYQLHRLRGIQFQGFVDKFDEGMRNLRAIELVIKGATYFSPRYILASLRLRRSATAFFKLLSLREQEVLVWVVQALSDKEIAPRLNLSPTTVQTHRRDIMRKLGIRSTPKLIRYGLDLGLDHEPPSLLPPRAVTAGKHA